MTWNESQALNITLQAYPCDNQGVCDTNQSNGHAHADLLCGFGLNFDSLSAAYVSTRLGPSQNIVISPMSAQLKENNGTDLYCGVIVPAYLPHPVKVEINATVGEVITPLATPQQSAALTIYQTCCNASRTAEVCGLWNRATTLNGMTLNGTSAFTDLCNMDNNLCDTNGNLVSWNLGGYFMSCNLSSLNLSAFSKLEYLTLFDNDLQGDVDQGMKALATGAPALQELDLSNNGYLSGQFSSSSSGGLCSLMNNGLRLLVLEGSPVEGSFPSCGIGNAIEELWIGFTNLTGPLPRSVSTASQLQVLDVSNSFMNGNIPSPLPSQLLYINATATEVTGPVPDISQAQNLTVVDLSAIGLSGGIPESFANHPNLQYLDVSRNQLDGLPSGWVSGSSTPSNEPTLMALLLHDNPLHTSFPAGLIYYPNLTVLSLDNISMSGPLPEIPSSGFPSLIRLSAYTNELSGSIPSSWSNVYMFNAPLGVPTEFFVLANNTLTGQIPSFLGLSYNNLYIDLSGNDFSNGCSAQFVNTGSCSGGFTAQRGSGSNVTSSSGNSDGGGGGGLSGGAIAGIIIALLLIVGAVVGFILWRRKKRASSGAFERFYDAGGVEMGNSQGLNAGGVYNPHLEP